MLRYVVFATFGILASVSVAVAEHELDSVHAFMQDTKAKCMAEFDIDEDFLKGIMKSKEFDKVDPCFMACFMREKKVIDDKGMFDEKQAYAIAEKFIKNSEKLEKIKKIGEACVSVNDADVSDGDKGCERALLMLQCFMENKKNNMS